MRGGGGGGGGRGAELQIRNFGELGNTFVNWVL